AGGGGARARRRAVHLPLSRRGPRRHRSRRVRSDFQCTGDAAMTAHSTQPRAFTGRHMLAAVVAFFGVIVAVNLTMATFAMNSWSGLVVKNSYVASQEFNDRAEAGRARAALGWQAELAFSNGHLRYTLAHDNGSAVTLTDVQ